MMSESQSGCLANSGGDGSGEIMLFGVRVTIDPMRKSVSMNNLSQYVQVHPEIRDASGNGYNLDGSAAVSADNGYASADDAVRNQSDAVRERKRGVPWTEEEHKLFLLGLQKVGKGDWRGISRNFVKTRTPTQVASHAQKYFLRHSNLNRRRRRSSLFDITTESVGGADIPVEEHQDHEDNSQPAKRPMLSHQKISPLSGFPMAVFSDTVGLVPSPTPIPNQIKTRTFSNGESTPLVHPTPIPNPSTKADLDSNQKHETNSLSLSLNLSLWYENDGMDSSALQVLSALNNRDGVISVG